VSKSSTARLWAVTALCTMLLACSSAPQPGHVNGAPKVAQNSTPPDQAATISPRDVDTYAYYKFRDGQTPLQLRLHAAILGEPHRNAAGAVDNAILFLHWTGSSSQAEASWVSCTLGVL
jgi:homoserine O-acetyltransferase/O-succinyltransferase